MFIYFFFRIAKARSVTRWWKRISAQLCGAQNPFVCIILIKTHFNSFYLLGTAEEEESVFNIGKKKEFQHSDSPCCRGVACPGEIACRFKCMCNYWKLTKCSCAEYIARNGPIIIFLDEVVRISHFLCLIYVFRLHRLTYKLSEKKPIITFSAYRNVTFTLYVHKRTLVSENIFYTVLYIIARTSCFAFGSWHLLLYKSTMSYCQFCNEKYIKIRTTIF